MNLKACETVILAGGKSSRMGRDKAFLPIGRKTLVERVAETMQRLTARVTVIGRADIADRLDDLLPDDVEVITDLVPEMGPLMGVYTALMHATHDTVICVPVDMPDLSYALLRTLLDALVPGVDAVAGATPDGWQPFPLVCRTSASQTVGQLLDGGRGALKDLLHGPTGKIIALTDADLIGCYRNLNTPDDIKKMEPHGLIAS